MKHTSCINISIIILLHLLLPTFMQAQTLATQSPSPGRYLGVKTNLAATNTRAEEPTTYRRRFIIEAWREGKPLSGQPCVNVRVP